jgi:predicted transport protein
VKPYPATEERLLFNKPPHVIELYETFKSAILNLSGEIGLKPKKREAGFIIRGKIFADISLHREYIKMWLNLKRGKLKDPKKIARDVSKLRHWGNGDYEICIRDTKNLDYIIGLVKHAIEINSKF